MRTLLKLVASATVALIVAAQPAPKSSFVGTVLVTKAAENSFEIKPDGSDPVLLKTRSETILQRVEPGERDLKNAQPIQLSHIAAGDRVLVNVFPGSTEIRRIVVMPGAAIAVRNEADRRDWMQHGVGGVVVSKAGNELTVRLNSLMGDQRASVKVNDRTSYRRYAPGSVRFADAQPSNLAAIEPGDQIRARGGKSEDGLTVEATEVVFGTFLTRAGVLKAADATNKTITIHDLVTNADVVVQIAESTQLKKMPGMPFGGGTGGSIPAEAAPPAPGPGGLPGPPGIRPGSGPDLSQMLEHMPTAAFADFAPGMTIAASATKGTMPDRITAIMVVANADFLIQMAQLRSRTGRAQRSGMSQDAGMPGANGGMLAGFDMTGLLQQ